MKEHTNVSSHMASVQLSVFSLKSINDSPEPLLSNSLCIRKQLKYDYISIVKSIKTPLLPLEVHMEENRHLMGRLTF